MSSVNNKPSSSPMDALGKLFGSVGNEAGRAVSEYGQQKVDDINSVSKGIETGGFLGGALQFLDVMSPGHTASQLADAATGPGALDPTVKEGISAAVNYAAGNPMVLKDLFDMFTSPSTPGVRPSPPQQAVPPPNVDQLRGTDKAPQAPGAPGRSGFSEEVGPATRNYEVHIVEIKGAHEQLTELTGTYAQLKNDPRIAERYPEIAYALNRDDWSIAAQSTVIIVNVLRDSPDTVRQLEDVAANNNISVGSADAITTPAPVQQAPGVAGTAPATTADGDFSQAGNQLGDMFKGIMGFMGPALSFLGPLLSNPAVIGIITPLIGAALAAIPGAQVLLPIVPMLPVILPLIGTGMTMAGGAMTTGAAGGDPLAALFAAGPSASGLGDLLGPIGGLLGAAGGAPGAPLAAAPIVA